MFLSFLLPSRPHRNGGDGANIVTNSMVGHALSRATSTEGQFVATVTPNCKWLGWEMAAGVKSVGRRKIREAKDYLAIQWRSLFLRIFGWIGLTI